MPSYYLDIRVGCVAVRDKAKDDPNDSGLHPDTDGVIKFWQGDRKEIVCKECGYIRVEHYIPEKTMLEANAFLSELQKLNNVKMMHG